METKRNKRIIVVLTIFSAIMVSNLIGSESLKTVRNIDFVRILALGMLIGVLIVNIAIFVKNRNQ